MSILAEDTLKAWWPDAPLQPSSAILKTYTGEAMAVIGELSVDVTYQDQHVNNLRLVIIRGGGPSLLGRNWLEKITLDWQSIARVSEPKQSQGLSAILEDYKELFSEELGTIHPYEARLSVPTDTTPKFCKYRSVPYAIREAVEAELDRLEQEGVLEKVSFSEWAAPIVAVPKKDGRIRICGDYKSTVNQAMEVDQYPLPRPEDLFATLAGGKHFSKLDLSHAYNQLPLHKDSQKYVTVNTHVLVRSRVGGM